MESTQWIYAVLVLATMPPMVPNLALLAGAGALAAAGSLSLPLLVLVLIVSTVTGDLGTFVAGRCSSRRSLAWLEGNARRRAMLQWTTGRLKRYGVPSVIGVRFVPSGRGLGGLTAGIIGYPLRSYLLGAAIAEAVFISYTLGLGYLGGQFTTGGPFTLLIGPGVSLLVAGVALAMLRASRRRPIGPAP